jgi:hypothetical protein
VQVRSYRVHRAAHGLTALLLPCLIVHVAWVMWDIISLIIYICVMNQSEDTYTSGRLDMYVLAIAVYTAKWWATVVALFM